MSDMDSTTEKLYPKLDFPTEKRYSKLDLAAEKERRDNFTHFVPLELANPATLKKYQELLEHLSTSPWEY